MSCQHFLAVAIAIQCERDPAARLRRMQELQEPARTPVLAWLWADAERAQHRARMPSGACVIEGNTGG